MGRITDRIFPIDPVVAMAGLDVPARTAWRAIREERFRLCWDRAFVEYGEDEEGLWMEQRGITLSRAVFHLYEDANPEAEEYTLGAELSEGPIWLREAREGWLIRGEGRFSHVRLEVFARIPPFFVRRYIWAVNSARSARRVAALKLWVETNHPLPEGGV